MPSYNRPLLRERLRALREQVNKRRKPNPPKAPRLASDDDFSLCDGYFLAAEEFLILAIEAKTEEDFEKFALLADSFEADGEACVALRDTL
jgi:hypothetical protein